MSTIRTLRLRTYRFAVVLAALISLLCLAVPNQALLPGTGRYLGTGKVFAADVTAITVDNSTSDAAVMAPTQRKLFHGAGRFWVFYTDGADLVYKSSPDGLSWSDRSASLGALSSGSGLSVHFDGIYIHYARSTSTNNEPLCYRRGIPDADGTIQWSAAEQVAVARDSGVRYLHPSISVDSSGHALISYHYEEQSGKVGEGPWIAKSANSDGTWEAAAAGFPYQLAADSESEWYTTVHALTADKIAVTFADHTNVKGVSVRTYDGANWNSTVTTISNPQFGSGYSAVAEGDDIHVALLTTSTFDLLYCKYTYATSTFGSEYALLNAATGSSFPSLARDSNNDLYCFWPGAPAAGHIYYMRMLSGVWDTGHTDWVTAETDLTATGGVSAFYDQGGSDYIGVAWETGMASLYDVRFAAVDTAVAPNQPPNQPGNVLPIDGATGLSLTPTLQSSGFSDPDADDTHGASQWQIRAVAGEYSDPVFDSEADNLNLMSILVPADKLGYSTTYYWRVRHQDNHGDWSEWSAEWSFTTVSAPVAGFSADRTAVVVGQPVTFTNISSGGVAPLTYEWDFGDGSLESTQNPNHSYSSPGTYTVRLTVTDSADNTAATTMTDYVTVADGLVADFSADRMLVALGQPVTFTNSSTGGIAPLTYQWDFNNDGIWDSTETNPSHIYGGAGTYTVVLKVTDDATNTANETKTDYITVATGLLADFNADKMFVAIGEGIQFTNLSGGGVVPLSYEWDFNNDGICDSTETNPSHIYGSAGIYTVVLKVTDDATNTATASKTDYVTVNQPPNPPANSLPVKLATGVSLTPMLRSSDFSDADAVDVHGASQWQIAAVSGDYSSPVFDSQADGTNLISILVPADKLGYSTTYYWHVRYQDNHGDWSDWSVETSFSTAAAPSTPPGEPDEGDTTPAAPSTLLDEPFNGDAGPALPEPDGGSGGSGSFLPFLVAIITGIAVVPIVGGTFYLVHARMLNKPKELRSARTISRRLRK